MSKIKNSGLDQYGAEAFEQQPFGTAGTEGVNIVRRIVSHYTRASLSLVANYHRMTSCISYFNIILTLNAWHVGLATGAVGLLSPCRPVPYL